MSLLPAELLQKVSCSRHDHEIDAVRQSNFARARWVALSIVAMVLFTSEKLALAAPAAHPNVVLILADDLGYGDLGSYGAKYLQTPNMDSVASSGMRFTDAHSPHSVCSPTRYGLLTGQYAWRTWIGTKTLWADDPLLIDTRRLTLPKIFKQAGYSTALIGKWHLGFGEPGQPGWDDIKGPDWNKDLKPGPLEVGFDYFFGIPHTGQEPHVLIENHRVVGLNERDPLRIKLDDKWIRNKVSHTERIGTPDHRFSGGQNAQYRHEDLGVRLTQEAVKFIRKQRSDQPFFLYFAHRNPHAPYTPNDVFKGKSAIGDYGDFISELDWSVGEILAELDRLKLAENTILIVTSDNGGVTDYLPSRFAIINGHHVNGQFFGQKTEAYEGGNRVPLLIRWPGVVPPGSVSNQLVALTDFMATFANMLGADLPPNSGEDSFSFLPVLTRSKPTKPFRESLVMDSMGADYQVGHFAIREGPWKLILGKGGGGVHEYYARHGPEEPGGQLYNLDQDPQEQSNVIVKYPNIVARLTWVLKRIQFTGGSH